MAEFTDEQYRTWARKAIQSSAEEALDWTGIGEQFEDEWADLSEAEFNAAREKVYELIRDATVTVTWPDEDERRVMLRARLDELTASPVDRDALRTRAAEVLRDWYGRNAMVCEHTQLVDHGGAADAVIAVLLGGGRPWLT